MKKYPKILGISGKMGVGKDYITKNFILPHIKGPVVCIAFADQFKIDVIVRDGIERDRVYITKDVESRNMLQKRGHEEGRLIFGMNLWVDYVDNWIQTLYERNPDLTFIITDVRYPNEMEYIKKRGGDIIRIIANDRNWNHLLEHYPDNYKEMEVHPSESLLDDLDYINQFDMVLSNSYKAEKEGIESRCHLFLKNRLYIVKPNLFKNIWQSFSEFFLYYLS